MSCFSPQQETRCCRRPPAASTISELDLAAYLLELVAQEQDAAVLILVVLAYRNADYERLSRLSCLPTRSEGSSRLSLRPYICSYPFCMSCVRMLDAFV